MRREQAQYIRSLRATLGEILRKALADYEALSLDVELKREMEDGELGEVAGDILELRQFAVQIGATLSGFSREYKASLGELAIERLSSAITDLGKAEMLLEGAQEKVVAALEKHSKTRILLQERALEVLRPGLALVRSAWDALFYATQKSRGVERIQLDASRSDAMRTYDEFWAALMEEADQRADEVGKVVEVYDSDGVLVYSTSPDVKVVGGARRGRWEWRPRPLAPTLTFARPLTTQERAVVQDAIVRAQKEGSGLRMPKAKELSRLIGVDLVEVKPQEEAQAKAETLTPNDSLDSKQHLALFHIRL